jgi:hypothetical protein
VKLTPNQRFVLVLLSRAGTLTDDEWRRDLRGRRWPKREYRFGHHGLLSQGRHRTIASLHRLGLVDNKNYLTGAGWALIASNKD